VQRIDLKPPPGDAIALIDRAAADQGLTIQVGTLAGYPGCTHWHFTKPGEKGTLEATWWPPAHRLWLSVHANRQSAWHESAVDHFLRLFPPQSDDENDDKDRGDQ
jgi:hypothetical protein